VVRTAASLHYSVVAAGVRASRLIRKREDGLVGCCYLASCDGTTRTPKLCSRGEGRALHLFLGASSDRLSFADQAWLGGVRILGCGDNERLVQLRVRAGAFYKPLTIMIRCAWNIRPRDS
jgi:hypothetical protein